MPSVQKIAPLVRSDVDLAKDRLAAIAIDWDGKESVLRLKDADYHWRQMEWWAFYFEYLVTQDLQPDFDVPGDRVGRVVFDSRRSINWDVKAKAIKSDDHRAILNDCAAINSVIKRDGAYGVMIGLCDVTYNDESRSFQRWHSELKGGLSAYEQERRTRTSVSRYRKTHAILTELLFVAIYPSRVNDLLIMNQGRNSNGRPRPPKYMIDLERVGGMLVDKIEYP